MLELDVYWAVVAGQDVTALVVMPDRVRVRCTSRTAGPATIRSNWYVVLRVIVGSTAAGSRGPPIAAILEATPSCEFDVVEFDHVDGDVFDAVSQSIEYLERRRGN